MFRYKLTLSYNGGNYCGWQIQPNSPSIQEAIENAFTKLFSNQPISVVGCGRTDTGVHAKHYVLHVDLPKEIDTLFFLFKLNKILPQDILIINITPCDPEFHARFDANKRTYRYFIETNKNPFNQNLAWNNPSKLDFDAMNNAAASLIGKKDFTSFSKVNTDVNNNICQVYSAIWVKTPEGGYFEIAANRFLRNMVRAIVGTLIDIGSGKLKKEDVLRILEEKNRCSASISVPAKGLFLWKIEYPEPKKQTK